MLSDVHERFQVTDYLLRSPVGYLALATDRRSQRRVVLKLFRPPSVLWATEAEAQAARLVARANGLHEAPVPGLPRVIEAACQGSQALVVCEDPAGICLRDALAQGQTFDQRHAVAIVHAVASAQQALHTRGLSPTPLTEGTVFFEPGAADQPPQVELVDALLLSPDNEALLWRRDLRPSDERFTAPEVMGGKAFTEAAYVYALGVLLYRLLAGTYPFVELAPEARPRVSAQAIARITPLVSSELVTLLRSTLDADPDQRPQSVAAFLTSLEHLSAGLIVQSTVVVPPPAAKVPSAPRRKPPRRARSRLRPLALGLVGVLLLAAAIGTVLALRRGRPPPEPEQSPEVAQVAPAPRTAAPLASTVAAPAAPRPRQSAVRLPRLPRAAPARPVFQAAIPRNRALPRAAPQPVTPTRAPSFRRSRTSFASVTVTVNGPRAQVFLDGVYCGVAPRTIATVPPGRRRLEIRAPGCRPWSHDLQVSPGDRLMVLARPEPQS